MFHQANMRLFNHDSSPESLLSLWFKSVLDEYRKYAGLPLQSLSFNQLIEAYNEREKYEECGISTRLVINDNKLIQIKLNSKSQCVVPITGLLNIDIITPGIVKFEKYGPDNTVYVKLDGSQSESVILLNSSISFK